MTLMEGFSFRRNSDTEGKSWIKPLPSRKSGALKQ